MAVPLLPVAIMPTGVRAGLLAEQARRAEVVPHRRGNIDQFENARIGCEALDGPLQPRSQPAADMDHHIRPLEHPRLRGAHRVSVRRCLLIDQKVRRSRALRHQGNKPVHRRDVGDDAQRRGRRHARRDQG